MSSSKPTGPRQVPPPPNSRAGNSYTRFIPREELQGFASWTPTTFGEGIDASAMPAGVARPQPEAPAEPPPEQVQALVATARQEGYRDGYRDGLVALESFKQSFAQQMAAQVGQVVQGFDREMGALEQHMAASVARIATQLARQIVRSELATRSELVVQVAHDAINAVLMSAKQITVYVHPDDQPMIAQGAGELLVARGARLVGQPTIARGGCLIESDAGTVDARIESRWQQAVQALGTDVDWPLADDAAEA